MRGGSVYSMCTVSTQNAEWEREGGSTRLRIATEGQCFRHTVCSVLQHLKNRFIWLCDWTSILLEFHIGMWSVNCKYVSLHMQWTHAGKQWKTVICWRMALSDDGMCIVLINCKRKQWNILGKHCPALSEVALACPVSNMLIVFECVLPRRAQRLDLWVWNQSDISLRDKKHSSFQFRLLMRSLLVIGIFIYFILRNL